MKSFFKKFMVITLFLTFALISINSYCVFAETKRSRNIFFDEWYKMPTVIAIALNHSEDENDILVFKPDEDKVNKLKKVFDHVYLAYDQKSYDEFMAKRDLYDRFFTCNWYHGRHTYLSPDKKYGHFEDGVCEYYREKAPRWLCNKERAEKMFMMFPEYRFSAFNSLPAEAISREKYLEAVKLLYDPKPIKNKIIYCLDSPTFFNSSFNKQMTDILKKYDKVAVKCHPRDGRNYEWPRKFKVLDKLKPFESFYYGFNGILISNISSCLHTAKFMQPESTVICTIFIGKDKRAKQFEKYIDMLKKLGVLFPKNISELKSMISKNINRTGRV